MQPTNEERRMDLLIAIGKCRSDEEKAARDMKELRKDVKNFGKQVKEYAKEAKRFGKAMEAAKKRNDLSLTK